MESGVLTACRRLDQIEVWAGRAGAAMSGLSGRTPARLRSALANWPAPMAEAVTGASRTAVQRKLAWMESRALVREVTGQNRFRMWRAVV